MGDHCAVLAGLCGLMVSSAGALAQNELRGPDSPAVQPTGAETIHTDSRGLEWSIEPSAWYVGLSGTVRLPRSTPLGSPTGKLHFQELNFDHPSIEPTLEVNVRRGNWRVSARGATYSAEKSASGLADGSIGDVPYTSADTLRSSVDLTFFELEGAYTFLGRPANLRPSGVYAFDPRLDFVFGARVANADISIENLSGGSGITRSSQNDWFFHPEVGVKFSTVIYGEVTADIQVSLGGLPTGNTSYGVDVIAGVQWNPTPNFGVQFGYRALYLGMSKGSGEGEFAFDAALQGLTAGLVFRF